MFNALVYRRGHRLVGPFIDAWLRARGTYVPRRVPIGPRVRFMHTAHGVVIDDRTVIGAQVVVFHGVTIGRARPWTGREPSEDGSVRIEDDVVLCAGAVITVPPTGVLTVARGTVLGANAVLTRSTEPWSVWTGNPASATGRRDPSQLMWAPAASSAATDPDAVTDPSRSAAPHEPPSSAARA